MVANWRQEFPIFQKQKSLIYLDSVGTSLKPKTVIKAVNQYNREYSLTLHSENSTPLFKKAWITVQKTRELIAQKIGSESLLVFSIIEAFSSRNNKIIVIMARKALIVKAQKKPKFAVRKYTRCLECGRSRSVFRRYLLCRIHFSQWVRQGLIPGFRKISW